ncbi:unnamed protein product [marine sediment metagenome]|uniref:Uncharacterized protein n=1 Tax=marine sediment metagenome TaxID=412755 RepID=X1R7J9_9ZZZZ
MQITQVAVGNVLYPLVEGQPLPIDVGQTLRVFYAFKYKMPETNGVRIWASLYRYTMGVLDRSSQAQTKETIPLEKALEWKDYSGEIDIVVGQIGSGTYGLICELPDYDKEDHIDDCIEVTAAPSIWAMIGPLLMLGLMVGLVSMMAPMMEEGVG